MNLFTRINGIWGVKYELTPLGGCAVDKKLGEKIGQEKEKGNMQYLVMVCENYSKNLKLVDLVLFKYDINI